MNQTLDKCADRNVIWLADYRRRYLFDDRGPPPTEPAAARKPQPPSFVEAIGRSVAASARPLVVAA
jgi:hypothetical protein